MSDIELVRGPFGEMVVAVPEALRPLDVVLKDCRTFPALLEQAIRAAGEPGQEWSHGGNAGWIEISGERVTLSDQFTEEETVLPREQFLELLLDFQRQLATWSE